MCRQATPVSAAHGDRNRGLRHDPGPLRLPLGGPVCDRSGRKSPPQSSPKRRTSIVARPSVASGNESRKFDSLTPPKICAQVS